MSIHLLYQNQVAVLQIDRPQALNALSFDLLDKIGAAITTVSKSDARALVIVGNGDKAFCAGADIKELQDRSLLEQKRGAELGQAVMAKLDRLPIPSIAVIHGYAFGGGLELALACTFRVATPKAKMGLPEIKLGLIPGYGGTQRLPRLIGEARALEIILSGRTVDAVEAERIGLVNRLVDGTDAIAIGCDYAQQFLGYSLCASLFAREAVQRALAVPLADGLRIESDLSTLAYQTADAREGMQAFVDKRPPLFKDQ
ncbi:enoyl-CoA hydratase-related protein [Herbaspirillum sp. RTI4]|uniref:enoyl-CoA hydratase/isomerase family protein n=1 Tax=Herbaspirillum sp. RTI4 TaxID=3048640 RepID=UPI002AB39087|nr:enoyl-CoA hydratase-related protein [Herbaspirillum sp. RTI4]MDY7579126.1 enoyl-CoA hydratase-related protein [Herbaspirillum sp. RTI4]MEA9981295.1 enoyl-CoA hydratase-related protein [Herbaspirillum sp. RTI4]